TLKYTAGDGDYLDSLANYPHQLLDACRRRNISAEITLSSTR
ncbi:hypothetical protein LCGC14_3138050, partial [marine sediment metagenome]